MSLFPIKHLPLVAIEQHQFDFTVWPSRTVSLGGEVHHGFDALVALLARHAGAVCAKDQLPQIGFYTTTDGHRQNESVERIHALCIDVDGGEPPDRMIEYLTRNDAAFVVYETWSHEYADPSRPTHNPGARACWRVVLFLAEPLVRSDIGPHPYLAYKALYTAARDFLWDQCGYDPASLDRGTKDVSRAWHPGGRPESSVTNRNVTVHRGLYLDAKAILASIPADLKTSRSSSQPVPLGLLQESELTSAAMETLAQELAPAWKAIGGKGVRHQAAMALAHVLVRYGYGADDIGPLVRRMAILAGDDDEVSYNDRSITAMEAVKSPAGFGFPFLRDQAPEVLKAIERSVILDHPLPALLMADLDDNLDWVPKPIGEVRQELARTLRDLDMDLVLGLKYPPGSSKTSAAVAAAIHRARRGLKTVLLSKTYDLMWKAHARVLESKMPWVVLVPPTAKNLNGDTICSAHDDAVRLAAAGWDVRKTLCPRCPARCDRESCAGYAGEFGDSDPLIILGVHGVMPEALKRAGNDCMLVVDEAIALYEEKLLAEDALYAALAAIKDLVGNPGHGDALRVAIRRLISWSRKAEEGDVVSLRDIIGAGHATTIAMIEPWRLHRTDRDIDVEHAFALGRVLTPLQAAATCNEVRLTVDDGVTGTDRRIAFFGPNPRYTTSLAAHRGPAVFIDASLDPDLLKAVVKGREVVVQAEQVDDSCDVDRVLLVWKNSARKYLVRSSGKGRKQVLRVRWEHLVGPWREVFSTIAEHDGFRDQDHIRVLFTSFKFLVDNIRNWQATPPVLPVDPHALEMLRILRRFLDQGHEVAFEHYGSGLGTNAYNDFDCVVTLGDPWIHMGAARREAWFTRGDFKVVYRRKVREEKAQMCGRLRTIMPEREHHALMIDVGQVAPLEWAQDVADVRTLKPGRPTTVMTGTVLPTAKERLAMGMTQVEVAMKYKKGLRTVQRWEKSPI